MGGPKSASISWPHSAPLTRPLRPSHRFLNPPCVEKHHHVKCLILGGGGDIVFSQSGQKAFQLLFAGQMKMKPFEVVATSPEPGAVTAPHGQRRELPPKDFHKPVHRFSGITSAISIYEPLLAY